LKSVDSAQSYLKKILEKEDRMDLIFHPVPFFECDGCLEMPELDFRYLMGDNEMVE
jgi:hypothetical protein